MATVDRLEYLLPCGHKSVSPVCFHCASEAFAAEGRAADEAKPPGSAGPSSPPGRMRQAIAGERLEYLLPCGHKSVGLVCFPCACEAFAAAERAADKLKPVIPRAVRYELTITVMHPPHTRRFAARPRRR